MEQWVRWDLPGLIDVRFVINATLWAEDGFTIKLSSDSKELEIKMIFPVYVEAYQYRNESIKNATFLKLKAQYGADFYKTWSFFQITNSPYLKWLSQKSATLADQRYLNHYCIIGGDEIIDILTDRDPEIEITFTDDKVLESLKKKYDKQERRGVLDDGRSVILRLESRYGLPTMEIQEPDNTGDRIKIRYGDICNNER